MSKHTANIQLEIDKRQKKIDTLNEEIKRLKDLMISIDDVVPFAVFDFCESDIIVMIPAPEGKFYMGGLYNDPHEFWTTGCHTDEKYHAFTRQELFDYLVELNVSKSSRVFKMVDE
jgi:hypothetical protein